MKYKEWLNQWLYLIKPKIKQCTYERYASIVRVQIEPELGDYELDELSMRHIQTFIAELSERYSPGTINCVVSVVRRSIILAEDLEVRQTRLKSRGNFRLRSKRDIQCLSVENQRRLERYVNRAESPKLFGITLCLYTGLRVGELMALKWSDIDFKHDTLMVNSTCRDIYGEQGYQKILDTPKTFTSKRRIPLPKKLMYELRQLHRESKSEYVISGKDGKMISKRSYQNTFSVVLKKLGLPHMGIHSLRHTFATRALECGMDVKTLSEILGHKSATITLNCYAHSLPEHKRAMMNKVGKMLQ